MPYERHPVFPKHNGNIPDFTPLLSTFTSY
jgi:hypothetical protein